MAETGRLFLGEEDHSDSCGNTGFIWNHQILGIFGFFLNLLRHLGHKERVPVSFVSGYKKQISIVAVYEANP